MKLFFKTFFCVAFLLSPALVCGQNSETYLQNADKYFEQGDYERAVKNYIVVQDLHGQDVVSKLEDSRNCLALLRKGDNHFFAQEYDKAKTFYQLVLETNPNDQNVKNRIATCDKNNKPKDYIELKSAKIWIQKSDISSGYVNWFQANQLCRTSRQGGFTDWRLPTINELMAIRNYEIIKNGEYWSSSSYSEGRYTYYKHLQMEGNYAPGSITGNYVGHYCRCVRTALED